MFSKLQKSMLGVLLVLCLMLALGVTTQGPRITKAALDESAALQRLTLQFSTSLQSDKTTIRLTPEQSIESKTDGRSVFVDFIEPLMYGTTYTVTIDTTDNRGKSAQVSHSFTTTEADIYYARRHTVELDEIRKTSIKNTNETVIFSHESLLSYQVAQDSVLAIVEESGSPQIILIKNSQEQTVDLPTDFTYRHVDATAHSEAYLFTLYNAAFETSAWLFNPRNMTWNQVSATVGGSLLGSTAIFTPDGTSLYYFDQNRNLLLDNPDDSREPLLLGVYDAVPRFLPNQRAIFTVRNNTFSSLYSDGANKAAPDNIQVTFQPLQLNSLDTYVYIAQRFDDATQQLTQFITKSDGVSASVIASASASELLYTRNSLSPNDQFLVTEEALQPVIYDNVISNTKPSNVLTRIRDLKSGEIVRTLEGFDVFWR